MAINADKPHLWKADVAASVDLYNNWFMQFAPKTYRDKRIEVTKDVETGLLRTDDLAEITPAVLQQTPGILPMLRMATCPPLARDRLVGLAYADKNVVLCMEDGACPVRMAEVDLQKNLQRIAATITKLLDKDIFPWLAENKSASKMGRARAATIIADRMCGAQSDPIIRNAQEQRQLKLISRFAKTLWTDGTKVRFLDPAIGTGSFYSALLNVFGRDPIDYADGFEVDRAFADAAKSLWEECGLAVTLDDFTTVDPRQHRKYNGCGSHTGH